jgi:hypothetical protein
MKRAFKVSVAIAASVGVLILLLFGVGFAGALWYSFTDEAKALSHFEEQFELVRLGDTEERVLSLLGVPDARETRFRLGQEEGFEEAYARAGASGSTQFLVWYRGIDIVFSVGIDEAGTVRARESGGT